MLINEGVKCRGVEEASCLGPIINKLRPINELPAKIPKLKADPELSRIALLPQTTSPQPQNKMATASPPPSATYVSLHPDTYFPPSLPFH